MSERDLLHDLERAAARKQALAAAHREKAKDYSREARDFRRVKAEIERKLGKDRKDGA